MSDLTDRLKKLEGDLRHHPMRHYTYSNLPFAVFCYRPEEEWVMRRETRLLQTRLEQHNDFAVRRVSLAELMWRSLDQTEGLGEIAAMEARQGFAAAQAQAARDLIDPEGVRLRDLLVAALNAPYPPGRPLGFIVRTGALAPALYRVSALLDQMTGHTDVPCVLFMPATGDALGLRFMGVAENEGRGSYHTKVYID
jgi:hypothetical protein